MGLLDKLLGREEVVDSPPIESTTCRHMVLTPRWDSLDDIGHDNLATSFHCESCGRDFSQQEARELRSIQGDHLRYQAPWSMN
jgi:hypothetical protein